MDIVVRRLRNRAAIAAAKAAPCTDCGQSLPSFLMWLFHERGPKRFSVGSSCDRSCTAVAEEIVKCVPVCYKCGPKRSAVRAAESRALKRALALPAPLSKVEGTRAAVSLTQMLRRESRKMAARERRRNTHPTKLAIDPATGRAYSKT